MANKIDHLIYRATQRAPADGRIQRQPVRAEPKQTSRRRRHWLRAKSRWRDRRRGTKRRRCAESTRCGSHSWLCAERPSHENP